MYFLLFTSFFVLNNASAGIPSTRCSTADAGVRRVVVMPGIESIHVKTGRDSFVELEARILLIKESNIQIIRNIGTTKTYSATLNISKNDGSLMPDPYATNKKEDGSIEVDAICESYSF
jgi:hypothetical protein